MTGDGMINCPFCISGYENHERYCTNERGCLKRRQTEQEPIDLMERLRMEATMRMGAGEPHEINEEVLPPVEEFMDVSEVFKVPSADDEREPEYTGKSVSYYQVEITNPTTPGRSPYTAECNDIIEALGMSFAEGNAFKAIWRMCAARSGKSKRGYTDSLYDAEKVVFFGERMVALARAVSGRGS